MSCQWCIPVTIYINKATVVWVSEERRFHPCRNVEQLRQWEADISEKTVQLQNPLLLEHSGTSLASARLQSPAHLSLRTPLTLWLATSGRYDEDFKAVLRLKIKRPF